MPQTFPITSLRFSDLILRVSEFMGFANYGAGGDGEAAVPTDPHDLDLAKRLVNDGYKRFISANAKWRFLYQYFELTTSSDATGNNVKGDTGRYFMPWFFNGIVVRDWEFNSDQYNHPVRVVSEAQVQSMLSQISDTTGPPHLCAFRRLPPADQPKNERRQWEAVFYPKTDQTLVLNIMLRAYPTGMQDLQDFHFAGAEHDMTIEAACLAEAEMQRNDQAGLQTQLYQIQLASSKQIDAASAPRSSGFNLDNSHAKSRPTWHPWYNGVDSVNGTTIDAAT